MPETIIKVKDAPAGSVIEIVDHRYGEPIRSGRFYKVSKHKTILAGRVSCRNRFGDPIRIHGNNDCVIVTDPIEGF